jgi:hypothetical protein
MSERGSDMRFIIRSLRRPGPALVICVIALFLAAAGTSVARTRVGYVRLGRTAKTAGGTGITSSSRKHPALTLKTTHKQPAASFTTPKGVAPFQVSSSAKVTGLNADLLDGMDSSAFQQTVTGSCTTGSAIRAIDPSGKVTCATFPTPAAPTVVPPSWQLGGSAGTNPANDFLGTTDNEPLVVKTDGKEAMRVTPSGEVGVGQTAPTGRLSVTAGGTETGETISSAAPGLVVSSSGSTAVEGLAQGGFGGFFTSATDDGVMAVAGSGVAVGADAQAGDGVDASSTSGVAVDAQSGTGRAISGNSDTNIGVIGNSTTRGVVGTLGGGSCPGTYAMGACGATLGDGVDASSTNGNGVTGSSTNGNGVTGSSTAASGLVGTTAHPSGGGTAAGVIANNTGGGDIFIGEANGTHVARINSAGEGFFDGGTAAVGADYAESVRAVDRARLHRGEVLSIALGHGYAVTASRGRYSPRVMGVYSTRPAVLAVGPRRLGQSLAGEVPVAMMGVVPTKVTAAGGAIRPGDLLTTSRLPGYAMRATPVRIHGIAIYPTGAILGKALQPLRHGRGLIKVLLMSH